jgi:predicted phage terminase large subunit-like protein
MYMRPNNPVVLSIDAAQMGGADNSFNVIQAWTSGAENHFLFAQWRQRAGYNELHAAYKSFLRKYRPSAVLIEDAANGSALIADARLKASVNISAVKPDGRPKAARLLDHTATIRKKRIHVLDEAELRNAFVSEVVGFPGEFDDQVDAMSPYLSFMATKPLLKLPPPPAIAVGVGFSLGPLSPLSLTTGRTFTSAPKIFNR